MRDSTPAFWELHQRIKGFVVCFWIDGNPIVRFNGGT
jgi:hypothetical protein